jgi:hypothetical protein
VSSEQVAHTEAMAVDDALGFDPLPAAAAPAFVRAV